MDRIMNHMKISYYHTKTLPKGIYIFAVLYGIGMIMVIQVFHILRLEPMHLGEWMLPLLGMLLFTHLAVYEWEKCIHEMTYVRDTPHVSIVLSRVLLYSIGLYGIIWGAFLLEVAFGEVFNLFEIVHGSFITSLYLGFIGMICAYLSGQRSVGYIVPFGLYLFDMFTFGKYTKGLYLFSLTEGNFIPKYNLLILIIIMLASFIAYLYKK